MSCQNRSSENTTVSPASPLFAKVPRSTHGPTGQMGDPVLMELISSDPPMVGDVLVAWEC